MKSFPILRRPFAVIVATAILAACNSGNESVASDGKEKGTEDVASISPVDRDPFESETIGSFDKPWAMDFMPGTDLLFITEMEGAVKFMQLGTGRIGSIESGLSNVDFGGQGGLGDIKFAPDWPKDETSGGMLYLSWVEAGEDDKRGAVVGRGKLICEQADACRLAGLKVIWRQEPKTSGRGHFSHRLAFSPDGEYLFVSSGERQKMSPAQDMSDNLGTIVRLNLDGSVPADNPYAGRGSPTDQIWSFGHRNTLGLAFDRNGNLWNSEMGPKGGDEVNLIRRGENYGWPRLSNGIHYDGKPIPDHPPHGEEDETREVAGGARGYTSPKISWVPSISPANLLYYDGSLFPLWQGSLLVGGLSGQTLVRIELDDQDAVVANRWPMGARIRDLEQGPDGAVYVMTDGREGGKGQLLKLTPPQRGGSAN